MVLGDDFSCFRIRRFCLARQWIHSLRQFGGCLDEFPKVFVPKAWLDTEYVFSVSSQVFWDVVRIFHVKVDSRLLGRFRLPLSSTLAWLGMCFTGFAGEDTFRTVFPSIVGSPFLQVVDAQVVVQRLVLDGPDSADMVGSAAGAALTRLWTSPRSCSDVRDVPQHPGVLSP